MIGGKLSVRTFGPSSIDRNNGAARYRTIGDHTPDRVKARTIFRYPDVRAALVAGTAAANQSANSLPIKKPTSDEAISRSSMRSSS